ncbi:beta-channel forming cytolysin [Bacillus sp. 196mf]|uniref:beta-channel forming cytolysin n=1 Tax=Bacillus sp. 196mf TaxID=1761754 RepID=UPI000D8CB2CF|nr:beta-channel forming cytolysin [Bacillus sp. 196mf]PYE88089.1 hemolysin II [Bacillus sp. 196mf]
MKKSNKNSKILVSTLSISTFLALSGHNIYAENQSLNTFDLGKSAKVYNSLSTILDPTSQIKTSLHVSFIEDPHSDKNIAILSTEGSNIPAGKKIISKEGDDGSEAGYKSAILQWASLYNISFEITEGKAKFYKVAPVNAIDSKNVTSTVGYKIGGSVKISDNPEGSISGDATWTTSTSYSQNDYKTLLDTDTDKKVQWRVPFVSAMNQGYGPYTQDSYHIYNGNQLFMKSRNGSVYAQNNFISSDEMPPLASYGFSPGMIAIISAEKDDDISEMKIKYDRVSDNYWMDWYGGYGNRHGWGVIGCWMGTNFKEQHQVNSTHQYKVDWKNHKLQEK